MKKLLIIIAALLCVSCLAESAGRELSGYYGKDIAQAAAEIGGLEYAAGEEYADNYLSDAVALRGNGGKVAVIELKNAPGGDSLCGVRVGMARKDVEALMDGCPQLWQYDEEIAYTVRADAQDELNNETLVVFFDELGLVDGAWYRASAV